MLWFRYRVDRKRRDLQTAPYFVSSVQRDIYNEWVGTTRWEVIFKVSVTSYTTPPWQKHANFAACVKVSLLVHQKQNTFFAVVVVVGGGRVKNYGLPSISKPHSINLQKSSNFCIGIGFYSFHLVSVVWSWNIPLLFIFTVTGKIQYEWSWF